MTDIENIDTNDDLNVNSILNKALDRKFNQKSTAAAGAKNLATLRKLLEGNEDYPPSEDLWRQLIFHIVHKKEDKNNMKSIQSQLKQEIDQPYHPSLPEPTLARFYYQGEYFFLDGKNQIYQSDPSNPLVGILVGNIYSEKDEKTSTFIHKVKLHKKDVCQLNCLDVLDKKIHDRDYYIDSDKTVYRGLHPQTSLIYPIGKLNKEGKIELKPIVKVQSEH